MPERQSVPAAPPHVRIVRYFEHRPWLGSTMFAVVPLVIFAGLLWLLGLPSTGLFGVPVNARLMLLLELMAIIPLTISRIRPGLAAGIIAFACVTQIVSFSGPGLSSFAVPLAVYACAKYGSRRVSLSYLIIALIGALLAGAHTLASVALQPNFAGFTQDLAITLVIPVLVTGFCAAVVMTSWLFGDLAGRRRREIQAVAEKNRLLERERDQEARLAADAERMRIAREMHDVISHSMSVMIAQADGGRYVLDHDPARAGAAFETIGNTGRQALMEMRRMLGVLRQDQDALKRRPAPGVHDVPQLIEDVRASGLSAQFNTVEAGIPELHDGVGLAVYRIIQEALTNSLKHGGEGTTATVWLGTDAAAGELVVEIHDTGRGVEVENDGAGSGLRGMAERARLYGGRVHTRAEQTGFVVIARFPLESVSLASGSNGEPQQRMGRGTENDGQASAGGEMRERENHGAAGR